MRIYLQYNPNFPDLRCVVCKQHKFLVLDQTEEWSWIHTHIDKPLKQIKQRMMIHYWHPLSMTSSRRPKCILSFKEVKRL